MTRFGEALRIPRVLACGGRPEAGARGTTRERTHDALVRACDGRIADSRGCDHCCCAWPATRGGAFDRDTGRTLRNRCSENYSWTSICARVASVSNAAVDRRVWPHSDHRGAVDAVVRCDPRAGPDELVGEYRAVVDAR